MAGPSCSEMADSLAATISCMSRGIGLTCVTAGCTPHAARQHQRNAPRALLLTGTAGSTGASAFLAVNFMVFGLLLHAMVRCMVWTRMAHNRAAAQERWQAPEQPWQRGHCTMARAEAPPRLPTWQGPRLPRTQSVQLLALLLLAW